MTEEAVTVHCSTKASYLILCTVFILQIYCFRTSSKTINSYLLCLVTIFFYNDEVKLYGISICLNYKI